MGKWNRRIWKPRNNYRDQFMPPPPTYYETEHKLRGAWKNTALPWEERYCISVGIPWQKVVVAKKYMHCHETVAKWDDCAGEETFRNAKKRFWANINGLPCDLPLLDTDMYNNEIDWDPKIDPELVLELDRAYFNPDEAEKVDNADIIAKEQIHNSVRDDKNLSTIDNPWEPNTSCGNEASEDVAHGWVRWDNSRNENAFSPWEQGNTQDDRGIKDNLWGAYANKSRNEDGGLKITTWGNCANKSWNEDRGIMGNTFGGYANKSWHEGRRTKDNMFGGYANKSRDWSRGGKNEQWKDNNNNSMGRDWCTNQDNMSKANHLDYRQYNESGRSWNDGSRKRERSQQYTSRHKSARFEADDSGENQHWRKEVSQNRVRFAHG